MAQIKTFNWVSTNPVEPLILNVGFDASEITTIQTTGIATGSWQWVLGMGDDTYLDVSAGTIGATDGFTPLKQTTRFGAVITGFTNAVNGVIAVDDTRIFNFAVGDTVRVGQLADDLSGESTLNGLFKILSLTPSSVTVEEDTSVTGYSVYVSGGRLTRVSDINDDPVAIENQAVIGLLVGVDVVGEADSEVVAIIKGENPVL